MAAVTLVDCILVSPPGSTHSDRGFATGPVTAGEPVVISGPAPNRMYDCSISKATGGVCHGFALKTVGVGGLCEFAHEGEIDGYVDLTPGASLSVAAGNLDNIAPTGAVQIRAVNATRIRFSVI